MASAFSAECHTYEAIPHYVCSACNTREAQCYCSECSKCFCDNCVKMHNQLFNNHPVFGSNQLDKWPIPKSTLDMIEMCTEHRDEKIKLFCENHDQLCCHTCIALHHKQCSKVKGISMSAKENETEGYQEIIAYIQAVHGKLQKLIHKMESNLESTEASYQQTLNAVISVRQKINAELDRLEKTTKEELDTLKATLQKSLETDRDNCMSLQRDLKCLGGAIQPLSQRSNDLLFIAKKKCWEHLKHSESFLEGSSTKTKYVMDISLNHDIEDFLCTQTGMGRLVNPNQPIYLHSMAKHGLKMFSDNNNCSIHGICQLHSGEMVVADYWNNKVKLLNQKFSVASHCQVSGIPWDMCQTAPSEVAITMGDRQEVEFISVTNGKLVKDRTLRLPHKCIGIAHHRGHLYVTSGTALYQYTLTGSLVKRLYKDTSGNNTVNKCATSLTGDKVYITNPDYDQLLTLARDGKVLATFSDHRLRHPEGVHVAAEGQVLVCGYASNTIVQVDSEGRIKIATLATMKDGVGCPLSVYHCRNMGTVVVASSDILVFKVDELPVDK